MRNIVHFDLDTQLITRFSTYHITSSQTSFRSCPISYGARSIECVLGEGSCQSLLAADLLAANKAVHGNCYCSIDVDRAAVFTQTHLGERF